MCPVAGCDRALCERGVDLYDDNQPPPDSLRVAAATESADQTIERSLREENQIVQVGGLSLATGCWPTESRVREAAGDFKRARGAASTEDDIEARATVNPRPEVG